MPNSVPQSVLSFIDRLGQLFAWLSGALILVLVLVSAANVISRYFFGITVFGLFDILQIGVGIVIFLALPLCTWKDEHVSVDVIYEFAPRWLRYLMLAVSDIVAICVLAAMGWRATTMAGTALEFGDSTALLSISYVPIWVVITITSYYSAALCVVRLAMLPFRQTI